MPTRKELDFEATALHEFSFLADYGFRLVSSSLTLVQYENDRRFVSVFHGRSSYELGVEIGRWIIVDGERQPQAVSILDVLRLCGEDQKINHNQLTATTLALTRGLTNRLAEITERFASQLLTNGDDLFDELTVATTIQSDRYLDDIRASRLRARADDAWQRREFVEVAHLYELLGQDSVTTELRRSERARLRYALAELGRSKTGREGHGTTSEEHDVMAKREDHEGLGRSDDH